MTVSKEMVRLRLYALCLAGDMAGLFCAFLAANWFVLGALWGEPGKPHGIVMFAMVAPLYALLAVQGGAYGINTIDHLRRGIVRALWALAQAALQVVLTRTHFELFTGSPALVGLALGMISGAVGMVLCYPFTTVILRMSSEQESASEATKKIVQADGPFGLWRGLLAGLLMSPRPGLAFVVVELLQPFFMRARGGRPKPGSSSLTARPPKPALR